MPVNHYPDEARAAEPALSNVLRPEAEGVAANDIRRGPAKPKSSRRSRSSPAQSITDALEEIWSVVCSDCDRAVRATTRAGLALGVAVDHPGHLLAQRITVRYAIMVEAIEQRRASRPHPMWIELPTTLLAHPGTSLIALDGAGQA
jgi:hypothetical protein